MPHPSRPLPPRWTSRSTTRSACVLPLCAPPASARVCNVSGLPAAMFPQPIRPVMAVHARWSRALNNEPGLSTAIREWNLKYK